jgi:hypothetical protein
MTQAPKWYLPTVIVALLWNVLGCAAYLSDVMLTPEDIAKMNEAQQALYSARTAWAVSATATAVWGGALGSLGLILRKRWATPVLVVSLLGVMIQDIGLFVLAPATATAGGAVYALQGLVLVVAVALVLLARRAQAQQWLA